MHAKTKKNGIHFGLAYLLPILSGCFLKRYSNSIIVKLVCVLYCVSSVQSYTGEHPSEKKLPTYNQEFTLQLMKTLCSMTRNMPMRAYKQTSDCMQQLIKQGANPDVHDGRGDSLLETAVKYDDDALVHTSLHHGATVDIQNTQSLRTPFMSVRSPAMAKLLLEAHADPCKIDALHTNCIGALTENPKCPISVFNYLQGIGIDLEELSHKGDHPLTSFSPSSLQHRGFQTFSALLFFGMKFEDQRRLEDPVDDCYKQAYARAQAIRKVIPQVIRSQQAKHLQELTRVLPAALGPCVMSYVGPLIWKKSVSDDTRKRTKRHLQKLALKKQKKI